MESYTVNTGDQGPIYERIDEFFQEIIKKLDKPANYPYLEIRLENHCGTTGNPIDNKTHMLIYEQKVIAVVTETRNDSNYIQFDFFKLPNKNYKKLFSQRKNLQ